MKKGPVGIDFFCGCGGMTAGLIRAGVEVLLGVDIDPLCRETYERNNRVPFECVDVQKLSFQRVQQFLKDKNNRPIVFSACAPCQPFSKARKNGKACYRNVGLMLEFLRFVIRFRPEWIICENVPQLKSSNSGGRIIRKFLISLENEGYLTDHRIVNAADFGVPQHRLRLIILASRISRKIQIPSGPTRGERPTVRQAIKRFPRIAAGDKHSFPPNHWVSSLSQENLRRIQAVPKNGGDLRTVPASLRPPSRKDFAKYVRSGKGGFFDVYGRMKWDAPAPTLTTRCNSYSNGRYGHPEQNRAISLREAAALQSFPDSYVFYVPSINDGARLVGNAVPVSLAFHLASSLLRA